MKSLTHKLAFVLLIMSVAPIIVGISSLYALSTAGQSLDCNDQSLQNLSLLLTSTGQALNENASLQENASQVAGQVNRAQDETSDALRRIGDAVLPKSYAISRIRFALSDAAMAERALLLALNMRHLEESELSAIRDNQLAIMEDSFMQIDAAANDYKARLDSKSESFAWDEFETALAEWKANHNDFMAEIANLERLVDDLVRGGPLFASTSRKAFDALFVAGKDARDLCETRIEALNQSLSSTTAKSVETAANLQDQCNILLRDLERETKAAVIRSHNLEKQIGDASTTAREAADAAASALAVASSRFRYLIVFAVVAILAAIFLGLVIARRISSPVKSAAEKMAKLARGEIIADIPPQLLKGHDEIGQLTRAMQQLIGSYRYEINVANAVSEGDFTKPIVLRSETDQLGRALRRMLVRTNGTLGRVNDCVVRVGESANQVSTASQSLSRGAQTSAAALEEITQNVLQVDAQAKENAGNAEMASELAIASRDSAQRGYDAVRDLATAMAEIQAAGKRIASVAKLIDDIAFQTNLLALNAAVEAARAGRYGKGFSVVADEVRSLSARSARAARETGQMVTTMTERMKAGMEMAERSDSEFRDIVADTDKVAQIFTSITNASNVQSIAVEQIARGLEQIDAVIQENTHNAEATANSAQWLLTQADDLRASVSRFRLLPEQDVDGKDNVVRTAAIRERKETGELLWSRQVEPQGRRKSRLLPDLGSSTDAFSRSGSPSTAVPVIDLSSDLHSNFFLDSPSENTPAEPDEEAQEEKE